MRVGVVGLGTMGAPMARHLVRAGHRVTVHNRTRQREEPLAALGAARAETPGEAAIGADCVLTCVSDGPDLEHVVLGPSGVAETLMAGAVLVDCSTVSPTVARRLAAALAERGAGFVDAPVSGGSEGAEKGTLSVFCGGADHDVATARSLLEAFAKAVTHLGPRAPARPGRPSTSSSWRASTRASASRWPTPSGRGCQLDRLVEALLGGAATPGCSATARRT
jgi:3-hydroxyisobutyrate dehydrogenase-like beta-hydroxyacid dehydrogenase